MADPIILAVIALLLLLVVGFPVGLSLTAAGSVYIMLAIAVPSVPASILFAGLDVTPILAIPFFILAAEILSRSGAIGRLVNAVDALIGHWPGGLPLVAVVSTMIFSAICGSSIATAAAMSVAVLPELRARGYPDRLSIGLIAAAGGLGILIPPSIPMIVYGLITGTSIGTLFTAGIVPGLMLGGLIALYAVWATRNMGDKCRARASWRERARAATSALPILLLPLIILGSIYGGVMTPTEASGVAVIYAALVTAGDMAHQGWATFRDVLVQACSSAASILLVIAGASVFAYAVTASGAPQDAVAAMADVELSPLLFLLTVNLIFIALGMGLEVISVILITMPILFPLIQAMEINPVHFGVILVVNMELAVLTPPVGLNLFVLSSMARVDVLTVFRSVLPFLCLIVLTLAIVVLFPQLSLWLPEQLSGKAK